MPDIISTRDLDLDVDLTTPGVISTLDLDLDAPLRDPEVAATSKATRSVMTDLNEGAIRSGQPLVATRTPFNPPQFALRNYLSEYTQGDLDLDTGAVSPNKLASEALAIQSAHPRLRSAFAAPGADPNARAAWNAHTEALARLNIVPPSPKETVTALSSITADWLKAGAANAVTDALGDPIRVDPSVDPAAAQDLLAKLIHRPRGEWSGVLTSGDRKLLERLGGDKFVVNASNQLQAAVRLNRKARLTGEPVRDPSAPVAPVQVLPFSGRNDYRLTLNDLERISPFAADLLYQNADAATREAQDVAALNQATRGGAMGQQVLRNIGYTPDAGALARGASGAVNFANASGRAFNALMLGVPGNLLEHGRGVVQGAGEAVSTLENVLSGKYDEGADPDYFARRYAATNQAWTRAAALADPEFGKSPAAEAEFILNSFPDLPDADRDRLMKDYYGGAASVQQILKRVPYLGASPAVNAAVGELAGPSFEDPLDALLTLAGAKSSYDWVFRKNKPALLKDPVKAKAFTDYDAHVAESGAWNPLEIRNRTELLDSIAVELNKAPDVQSARDVVDRFHAAAKEAGTPLTPELAAQVKHAADILNTKAGASAASNLSDDAKAALREMVEPIASLNPIDQQFVVTGQDAVINAEGGALRDARAMKWYEEQSNSVEAVQAPRMMDRDPGTLATVQSGLMEGAARRQHLEQSRARLTEITDDASARIGREIDEQTKHLATKHGEHADISASWNSAVKAAAERAIRLDIEGGTEHVPNPATKTPAYRKLAQALADRDLAAVEGLLLDARNKFPGREAVITELARLSDLQRAETAAARAEALGALSAPDQVRTYSEKGLARLRKKDRAAFEALIQANAPDLVGVLSHEKIIEHLKGREVTVPSKPVDLTGLQTEPVNSPLRDAVLAEWAESTKKILEAPIETVFQASPTPRKALHDSLTKRLSEAGADPVRLTQDELSFINRYQSQLGAPLRHQSPPILTALDRDIRRASGALDSKRSLLQELDTARSELAAAGSESPRVRITPRLSKALAANLDSVPPSLQRKYLSLAPDASQLELTASQALKESLSDLSADQKALISGVSKLSGLETSLVDPRILRHELDRQDRLAQGLLRDSVYTAKYLAKRFGKEFSAADRQRMFEEIKTGKPTSSEALALMQDQMLGLVGEALKEGVITASDYAYFVDAPYAHNVFDRRTEAQLAEAFAAKPNRLPGYVGFKIDPRTLKTRVPENGAFYVAHQRPDGQVIFKDGFADEAAAADYVRATFPEGSKVSVQKTWPRIQKEILAGLVTDPGTSHLSAVEDLALAIHNNKISRALVTGGQAIRASDMAARGGAATPDGAQWTDASGQHWIRYFGNKNPWLEGRYISAPAAQWLHEYKQGFGFLEQANQGITDGLKAAGPALVDPASNLGSKIYKGSRATFNVLANLFSYRNILFSPTAYINGWRDNLSSGYLTGFNIFNPKSFARSMKWGLDHIRAIMSGNMLSDPWTKILVDTDLIRLPDNEGWHKTASGLSRNVEASLDQNWRTLEPLMARRDRLSLALEEARKTNPDAATDLAVALTDVENQITAAARPATKSFWRSLTDMGVAATKEAGRFVAGKSNLARHAWNLYSHLSGDYMSKVFALRHLVEVENVPIDRAVDLIGKIHQQLHRVPASSSALSRAAGGAMYSTFPADKIRRLANTMQSPYARQRMLQLLTMIASWNMVSLSTNGVNPNDYLEIAALRDGRQRSALTDAAELLATVKIPAGDGSFYSMSTGSFLGDILTAQSPWSRSLREKVNTSLENQPVAAAGLNAGLGLVSKFVGADMMMALTSPLLQGRDERGNPISDLSDTLAFYSRAFLLPKGVPGTYEYDTLARAYLGEEIDLRTNQPVPFAQTLLKSYASVRPELDTRDRFKIALYNELKANDPTLKFLRAQHEDDMFSTFVTREALRADGSFDPVVARQAARTWFQEHPKYYTTPGGLKVIEPMNEDTLAMKTSELATPAMIRQFKNQGSLPVQFSVLANWLAIDPTAPTRDPAFYGQIRKAISDKLLNRAVQPDDARKINERMRQAFATGRISQSAAQQITSLMSLIRLPEVR